MSSTGTEYGFGGGDDRPQIKGPLAAGDYSFTVDDFEKPKRSEKGNWVLPLKLIILPTGHTVWDNPWSGIDKNGNNRDGIGEFLLAINRAPKGIGDQVDWASIRNAQGRVRLKVVTAEMGNLAGQEVNKVAFYHRPKSLDNQQAPPPTQHPSSKPAQDDEPGDITF